MLSGPSPRAALRGATARSASRSTFHCVGLVVDPGSGPDERVGPARAIQRPHHLFCPRRSQRRAGRCAEHA